MLNTSYKTKDGIIGFAPIGMLECWKNGFWKNGIFLNPDNVELKWVPSGQFTGFIDNNPLKKKVKVIYQ